MKNATFISQFNASREAYISKGKLVYKFYNPWEKREVTYEFEAGKDGVTEELIIKADEDFHEWDLQDRYEEEHRDYTFQNETRRCEEEGSNINALENLPDVKSDIWERLFPEITEPSEMEQKVRAIIETLTPEQQNLFFARMGEGKKLEDIRLEEAAITGKTVTHQAISNRWKKVLGRFCKEFGVPVPKMREGKRAE